MLKTIARFATIGVRDFQRVIAGLSATASDSGNEGHRGGTAAANGRNQFLLPADAETTKRFIR